MGYRKASIVFIALLIASNAMACADEEGIQVAFDYGQGIQLFSVWGSSKDDVYAAGNGGTILHYDGKKWQLIMGQYGREEKKGIAGSLTLTDVWGTGENDVYVASAPISHDRIKKINYFHYDGNSWEKLSIDKAEKELRKKMRRGFHFCLPGIQRVWGFSNEEFYGVEGPNLFVYKNGRRSKLYTGPSRGHVPDWLSDIWGFSSSEVYVVSFFERFLQYDGKEIRGKEVDMTMTGIWGSSPSDIYVVGFDGSIILHYDGQKWQKMQTGLLEQYKFFSIWGSSKNDIFVTGTTGIILHYDGKKWRKMMRE